MRLSNEICYITEKIDGTNGVIFVPDYPAAPVHAGSRERWLTDETGGVDPKKDNFGFGVWVQNNSEELRKLGPGYHYGEWFGSKIQRGYGMTERKFASFEHWRDDLIPLVTKVPVLYTGEPTATIYDEMIEMLKRCGSTLVPGFMKPEGIVITYKGMHMTRFKKLCENDKLHKFQQKGTP